MGGARLTSSYWGDVVELQFVSSAHSEDKFMRSFTGVHGKWYITHLVYGVVPQMS